jgi:hypothetical protein
MSSLLVATNMLFLMESVKIVVAIFCHLSDNGGEGDGSGKVDSLVR